MQPLNKKIKDFRKLPQLYSAGAIFTSFDTETTSITPTTGRIMELGAVKFNKDGEIGRWSMLFNPQMPIPLDIQNLTHITPKMVENAPCIESYLPEFLEFISGSILLAHNAQFDINFLSMEINKAKLLNPRNRFADTLQFSIQTYPDLLHHKLSYLADYLKINPGNSHRALDDAITCMELFKKMLVDFSF